MKTETCKLYSRDFWIFLPKIIKIDLYNSELYRFKVGAFLRHSVIYTDKTQDRQCKQVSTGKICFLTLIPLFNLSLTVALLTSMRVSETNVED